MQSTLITAAGCQVSPFHRPACMRQQQRLAPLPHRPQQQQQPIVLVPSGGSNNSKAVILRATKPDRGSLAALEAAVGAINGILGAHSNRQKQKQQKQQKQKGPPGSAAPPPAQAGPSKLISFSAKASSSVPVKEWFKIRDDPVDTHNSSSSSSASSSSANSSSHKPSSRHQQLPVPSKPPALSEWVRPLQAYLSLPLEQYSVLDPSLITRLPPGTDTELLLTKLLAARKERQEQQQQAAAAAKAAPAAAAGDDDSSNGSSGTSLEPKMRQLEEAAAAAAAGKADSSSNNGAVSSSDASTNSATTSSSNSQENGHAAAAEGSSSSEPAASSLPPAPAAGADAGEVGGCFLLRIPMQDLVGIALEPLLIITVDIDPVHGQVKFRASRLVVGDPRFDAEFKVDLTATMSSKITKQPHIVHAGAEHGPAAAAAAAAVPGAAAAESTTSSSSSTGASASSSNSGNNGSGSSSTSSQAAAVAVAEMPAVAAAPPAAADGQQQQQQQPQALYWQRTSALSCKVNLSMTLRLPHPLSIVPGPLLSTTAGLVAKLVMQSLLPSFLELLATDYGRWATGSSRAAPVGSLVAAGKQYLKGPPQPQQSSSSSSSS